MDLWATLTVGEVTVIGWWCAAAVAGDLVVLGNSYVHTSDFDVELQALLQAESGGSVSVDALTSNGMRWVDHVARTEIPGLWNDTLVDADAPAFGTLILQEQSQILGLMADSSERKASLEAALTLDAIGAARGAETMLLMTWGRRDGDAQNPKLYPDFTAMNERLLHGTLAVASELSVDGRRAWVAPAGLAFQRVFDEIELSGSDPLEVGSSFMRLYQSDGSHPSLRGTVLAAMTTYAAHTGRRPAGLLDAPPGLEAEVWADLERVAGEVVLGDPFGPVPYRWARMWDGDVHDALVVRPVIGEVGYRPMVRLDGDGGDWPSLRVGGSLDDPLSDGELWATEAASLQVAQLDVELGGTVRHEGGEIVVGTLQLGRETGSGTYVLEGTGHLDVISLSAASMGEFHFVGGTVTLRGLFGAPLMGSGVVQLGGAATVDGPLEASALVVDLEVGVAWPTLTVHGPATVSGGVRVSDGGVTLPVEGHPLLIAEQVVTGDPQLPDGWTVEVSHEDGQNVLRLFGPSAPTVGDRSSPAPQAGGCACGGSTSRIVVSSWFARRR